MISDYQRLLAFLFLCLFAAPLLVLAEDQVLKPGQFPADGTGTYLAGELVIVDPANRRGGLRLDGNEPHDRYHSGPLHYFAMLPFGSIWFNGAPAELRDISIGTHVHGYFHLPPVGEEGTIPPLPKDQERHQLNHNHAVSLEDDFSFYQRRGQAWKVVSTDSVKGKINVAPTGKMAKDGINAPYTFDINDVSRIWKGRTLVDLADVSAEQVVQFNLGWSPGGRDKEFTVTEIWLDDASRTFAADLQRRRHVRYQKQRWLPGWVDHVEHNDYGGGVVTLTLFGGMDSSLYADLKTYQDKGYHVAVAEKSLRTWFHRSDRKLGKVAEWNEVENPPPGSSGIQIKMTFTELLEGYRPGRCVRLKSDNWPFVTMPPEERIKSVEDQKRSTVFSLP